MYKLISRLKLLIPDLLFVWLLASCITYAINTSLHIDISYFSIVIFTILLTVLYLFIFWNLFIFLSSFSLTCFGLVVFIAFFDDQKTASKVTLYFLNIITRVYSYLLGEGNLYGIENIISLILCFIITLICFFIIVKFKAYTFSIITAGIFFGVQSIYNFIVGYFSFYIYVFTAILLYIYEINHKRNIPFKYVKTKLIFLLSAVPIVLIIFFTTFTMPFSKEPIKWPWMDNKVARLYNNISTLYDDFRGRNDYFSLDRTGFGDSDTLGGSLLVDDTMALQVWTDNPTYLKARGKDTYTGYSWKDSFTEQKDILDISGYATDEFYELNFGPKLLNSSNQYNFKDIYKVSKYNINFLNIRTKSLFIPIGTMAIDTKGVKTNNNFNMSTSMAALKKADFKYDVVAQIPRFESDAFSRLLQKSYNGLYKDSMRRAKVLYWTWNDKEEIDTAYQLFSNNERIILDKYANRADLIRNKYTILPDGLPQRVKDLAFKITEGKNTNYEKAKAIEKYLSGNYTYTLEPGKTPKEKDFVDYFLFEQKQGYCVHYATSMAVLARVLGLPSRYVEGYRMPSEKDNNGSYIVTNQNAHSWAEIYFEGAGWVQFEATAPFFVDFYTQNNEIKNNDELIINEEEGADDNTREIEEEEGEIINNEIKEDNTLKIIFGVIIFIIASILMILLISVINYERYRNRIRKHKKLLPNSAMVKLYGELLHIMKKLGYEIKDNETAIQYGKRVDGIFYIRPKTFEQLSNDFTEARYGSRQIDIAKIEGYEKVYTRLLEIFKSEKGKLRYLIEHYFFGKI